MQQYCEGLLSDMLLKVMKIPNQKGGHSCKCTELSL